MTPELREKLLLRMFSSIRYMEEYSKHFIEFIDAGLLAFDEYQKLSSKPFGHPLYSNIVSDVRLWSIKVIPNFLGMKQNIQESISAARKGDLSGIEAAAGNFRGLNKDMDGIRESFMDFVNPAIKNRYFSEWEIVSTMSDNIYLTLSNYWRDDEIFDEEITGLIDEPTLFSYLQPNEIP